MTSYEERRQAEIAAELEEVTRVLAHSTRTVPGHRDSSRVLRELQAVTDHLAQACRQLAAWHDLAAGGTHVEGEDGRGGGGSGIAAAGLRHAAAALSEATGALMATHAATGGLRWDDTPRA